MMNLSRITSLEWSEAMAQEIVWKISPLATMTRSGFIREMEEILDVPTRTLQEEDSRETVAQWTPLTDVQIFSLITSEFGIEPDSGLIEAETVGDLLMVLQSRGAFRE
jgi:hypothetical protein